MSGFRPSFRFSATVSAAAVTAAALLATVPQAHASVPTNGARIAAENVTGNVARSTAKASTPATHSKRAVAPQDYTFYDSTVPSQIPANQQIAAYADGAYKVERSSLTNPDQVIWIDINGGDANASALDVEPGDASPSQVAAWVRHRLTAHPDATAIVYTMRSDWTAAKASVATLPAWMRSRVRWWIADPTGKAHIVPGSQATQWYWGDDYDINSATPGF
jgi:hypothetical protein